MTSRGAKHCVGSLKVAILCVNVGGADAWYDYDSSAMVVRIINLRTQKPVPASDRQEKIIDFAKNIVKLKLTALPEGEKL